MFISTDDERAGAWHFHRLYGDKLQMIFNVYANQHLFNAPAKETAAPLIRRVYPPHGRASLGRDHAGA